MTAEKIIVNLGSQHYAPKGDATVLDILRKRLYWPSDAACATQESDGEFLYWSAPVDLVIEGRKNAGERGMVAEVGFRFQIDSWYESDDPMLASDWDSSVVTSDMCINAYGQGDVTE